jgi:hypothetical protein
METQMKIKDCRIGQRVRINPLIDLGVRFLNNPNARIVSLSARQAVIEFEEQWPPHDRRNLLPSCLVPVAE